MTEVVTIGEKGQLVIPKQIRDDFKITKGMKLLITEDQEKIVIRPVQLNETQMLMLLSESSLKKTWDNKYDERWDDVL
jgi:AbrB family looped-hinge helix DNA binding protein